MATQSKNKGSKLALGILALLAVGGTGYYFYNSRKKGEQATDDYVEQLPTSTPSAPIFNVPSAPIVNTSNLDYKFTNKDKPFVILMQKMLGVGADGAWGAKTTAALPKGLVYPFSLHQLKAALVGNTTTSAQATNIKNSGLKVGDNVYAAFTTDVEVTKGAKFKDNRWITTGDKRKQEVYKGQYLGVVKVLNPYTVLILNSFNELVLANYPKVTKTRSLNGFGEIDEDLSGIMSMI